VKKEEEGGSDDDIATRINNKKKGGRLVGRKKMKEKMNSPTLRGLALKPGVIGGSTTFHTSSLAVPLAAKASFLVCLTASGSANK
jgi:hypothetical protein